MSQITYYTEEGLKKLKDELKEMEGVQRPLFQSRLVKRLIKEIYRRMLSTMQPKKRKAY